MRIGTKKRPFYRVVAVDERRKRTGGYLELLGTYNPLTEPKEIKLKQDRIDYWMRVGAVQSEGFLRIIGKAPQRPPRKPKKEQKKPPEEAKPEQHAIAKSDPEPQTIEAEQAVSESATKKQPENNNPDNNSETEADNPKQESNPKKPVDNENSDKATEDNPKL